MAVQGGDIIKDGKGMRVSPRINQQQCEPFDANMMRKHMRVCRVINETARERLMKTIEMMEE